MRVSFPLAMILALSLSIAVVIAGCGDETGNSIAQEQEYNNLEGIPLALLSTAATAAQEGRNDPYTNFRFRVEIDGIVQASFSEAILLESTVGVIEYREGNEPNPTVARKLPGRPKYGNLVLRWGITDSMELYNWYKGVLLGKTERKNLSVILMDEEGTDKCRWNFAQAWPRLYDAPDLDAMGNGVAIETLEIVFESMERVS